MKRDRTPKGQRRKALTLKDFPEDLIWQAKATAAAQRITLKVFIIVALERAVREA